MHLFYILLPGLLILLLTGCRSQSILNPGPIAYPYPPPASTPSVSPVIPYPLQTSSVSNQPPNNVLVSTSTGEHFIPTPTFATVLMQPIEFTPPVELPEGTALQIFEVGGPVNLSFNYDAVLATLKEKSFFNQEDLDYRNVKRVAAINQAMAPFNYQIKQLEISYKFSLYQEEKLLLDGIGIASRLSVNRSQTDFVLIIDKFPTGGYYLVRKDGLVDLAMKGTGFGDKLYQYEAWPQFNRDDLMYAREETEYDNTSMFGVVKLYRNDEVIYQIKTDDIHSVRPALYAFWTYIDKIGDHWCLEVLDQLHIDGQPINERYGYQKSYEFHLLSGKPVFMFEKDGKFGLNVDGIEVPLPGEKVAHYNCCDYTLLNPRFTDQGLRFFLKNGEQMDYVEMMIR